MISYGIVRSSIIANNGQKQTFCIQYGTLVHGTVRYIMKCQKQTINASLSDSTCSKQSFADGSSPSRAPRHGYAMLRGHPLKWVCVYTFSACLGDLPIAARIYSDSAAGCEHSVAHTFRRTLWPSPPFHPLVPLRSSSVMRQRI